MGRRDIAHSMVYPKRVRNRDIQCYPVPFQHTVNEAGCWHSLFTIVANSRSILPAREGAYLRGDLRQSNNNVLIALYPAIRWNFLVQLWSTYGKNLVPTTS